LGEEEVRLPLSRIASALDEVHRQLVAERGEGLGIEHFRGFDVGDVERYVIDHG
jgi:hypothetical protein